MHIPLKEVQQTGRLTERQTERPTERQAQTDDTDRQANDRQSDRQANDRQSDRQTDGQTETDRQRDRQTDRQIDRQIQYTLLIVCYTILTMPALQVEEVEEVEGQRVTPAALIMVASLHVWLYTPTTITNPPQRCNFMFPITAETLESTCVALQSNNNTNPPQRCNFMFPITAETLEFKCVA
jgi:hypothetical protein